MDRSHISSQVRQSVQPAPVRDYHPRSPFQFDQFGFAHSHIQSHSHSHGDDQDCVSISSVGSSAAISEGRSSVSSLHSSSHTSWGTSWFHDDGKSPTLPQLPARESVTTNSTHSDAACEYQNDDWFGQYDGQLDISDDPPSRDALDAASNIPVYDAAGNSRAFKSLYCLGDVVGDRQLIVFIRHFYCGACQAYIRALTQTITAQAYFTMSIPTSIIVVGCGNPELIRHYKAQTQCPFPIFADPSREIFKLLGMRPSLNMLGGGRPEYMKDISVLQWGKGQRKEVLAAKGKRKFMGGNLFQIGGEFLFQEGEVVWCHRMKNYRGHAEMDVIKRLLQMD